MWSFYNNDNVLGSVYGKLYNYFAVNLLQMDIDYFNIANPTTPWGWKVPSLADFQTLSYILGGDIITGGKVKVTGIDYFNTPNTSADNSSGFTLLGGGQRLDAVNGGGFSVIKIKGALYTYEAYSTSTIEAVSVMALYDSSVFNTVYLSAHTTNQFGYGVRLIKSSGNKLTAIGDSITSQMKWLVSLLSNRNFDLSHREEISGRYGYKAMGVASSRIIPLINNTYVGQQITNSIYERADDVKNYNPNTILLWGAENDLTGTLGTINDSAYTGVAVSSNPPTFYSAYKGTLEKLIAQNPNARIICVTPMYSTTVSTVIKQTFVDAIIAIASLYGKQSIDLFRNVNITSGNYATYLLDGVHPNDAGGVLIGTYMASQI